MISQRNIGRIAVAPRLLAVGLMLAATGLAGCADSFPKLPTFGTGTAEPMSKAQQNAELEELKKAQAENLAKGGAKPPIVPAAAPVPAPEPAE